MAKEEREFLHESLQDPRSIVAYLDALKEGFVNGTLTLRDERGDIALRPNGLIRLQIDTARKRDRVKMVLRLEWKEEDQPSPSENSTLLIKGTED